MQFWRLESLKFAGQTGRLETQGKADIDAQDQRHSKGGTPLLLRGRWFFLLEPSSDKI